ncbi:phytase [Modestobacter sp. I12A-02628]|uniref:Phytase n=1 Tax=Goekera deserti TaxID=2497753 RepID=A0A7K3WIP6_9ACTN|nr:phytase [Goekera deserti]NDI46955.1 phytase [Goekera deserti]NEL56192.1 phytase [Goekera deserti]
MTAVGGGVLVLVLLPVPSALAKPDGTRWATVTASVETPSAFDDEAGGNADADDPALWVHPTDGDRSVVVGALKNGGLGVYGLDGALLQSLPAAPAPPGATEAGRYNNVDVVTGVRLGGRTLDLAVVSDRGRDRVRVFSIDPRGSAAGAGVLTDVTAPDVAPVFSADESEVDEQATAYGLAAGRTPDGGAVVLTTRRHSTDFATLRLVAGPDGTVGYRTESRGALPTEFALPGGGSWTPCEEPGELPQMEGSVYDPASGSWYVAQEDVGIWHLSQDERGAWSQRLVDRVRAYGVPATFDEESETCQVTGDDPGQGGTHLTADAEGLTIAQRADGKGYLFASSQGDSTFAVYELRGSNRYVGGFRVADGAGIDGVQHSDGATVTTKPVGTAFPHGLLITHDGENTPTTEDADGEDRVDTDFKLVPLERVARPLGLRF